MLKIWSAVASKEDDREDIGEKPHKRKKSDGKVPTRVSEKYIHLLILLTSTGAVSCNVNM